MAKAMIAIAASGVKINKSEVPEKSIITSQLIGFEMI